MKSLFSAEQDIPQAWPDTCPLKELEATWNAECTLGIKSISGRRIFASGCFISCNINAKQLPQLGPDFQDLALLSRIHRVSEALVVWLRFQSLLRTHWCFSLHIYCHAY